MILCSELSPFMYYICGFMLCTLVANRLFKPPGLRGCHGRENGMTSVRLVFQAYLHGFILNKVFNILILSVIMNNDVGI